MNMKQLDQAFRLYMQITYTKHFNDWLRECVKSGYLTYNEETGEYSKNTKVIERDIDGVYDRLYNKNGKLN